MITKQQLQALASMFDTLIEARIAVAHWDWRDHDDERAGARHTWCNGCLLVEDIDRHCQAIKSRFERELTSCLETPCSADEMRPYVLACAICEVGCAYPQGVFRGDKADLSLFAAAYFMRILPGAGEGDLPATVQPPLGWWTTEYCRRVLQLDARYHWRYGCPLWRGNHSGDAPTAAQSRTLDGLFQAFQELTTSVGTSIAALALVDGVEPALDQLFHTLERDCAGLQAGLDAMRDIIDLLPVHAVITRLFPTSRSCLGEQELWSLERVAREVYESSQLAGANEGLAYDAAHAACVALALKRLGVQDLTDLPDDVCWLIQAVLVQVKMLLERRRVMLWP